MGQLFRGSKFPGTTSIVTAFGGTVLPPCAANNFSCALRGMFALTVEPGENGTPAKFKELAAVVVAAQATLTATSTWAKGQDRIGRRKSRDPATLFARVSRRRCSHAIRPDAFRGMVVFIK